MRNLLIAVLLMPVLASCSRPGSTEKEQKATEQHEPTLVEMGIDAQKQIGLRVTSANVEPLKESIEVTGTVQPIDSHVGHIRPLTGGRLRAVLAKVGDRVTSGQPLAQLDNVEAGDLNSQYLSAQADLKKLQAQQAVAQEQLERDTHLVAIGAVSQKELDSSKAEAKAMQASIEAQESLISGLNVRMRRLGVDDGNQSSPSIIAIRSPFAGVVINVAAAPDTVVDPSSELFEVADLSRVWVQADVYEKDIGRIRVGQMASISVDSYPGEKFTGEMTYIGDIVDLQTRTVKVRCEVPNPTTKLKLGMFVSVSLPTIFNKNALAVPATAIQQVEADKVVFVQRDATHFEKRVVQLGEDTGDWIEIISGLQKGEKVVSQGAFFVKSELLKEQLGGEE